MTKTLVEYIRKGGEKKYHKINGRRKQSRTSGGVAVGVMVALVNEPFEVSTGWSLCHKNDDKFDKSMGIKIAIQRARNGKDYNVPHSVFKKYERFVKSSKEFFNGGVVSNDQSEDETATETVD